IFPPDGRILARQAGTRHHIFACRNMSKALILHRNHLTGAERPINFCPCSAGLHVVCITCQTLDGDATYCRYPLSVPTRSDCEDRAKVVAHVDRSPRAVGMEPIRVPELRIAILKLSH